MIVNGANLASLGIGFSAAFKNGLSRRKEKLYTEVAMTVLSTTAMNEYGWLGEFPRIREWIGDRVVKSLGTHGYSIVNREFESTIGVQRKDVEDDNYGIYSPMFEQLGQQADEFPEELVWPLLKAGFTTPCYDGQYYFDTDHPVLNEAGATVSVSNSQGGSGLAWYLIDASQVMKPIIFQSRKPFQLIRKDDPKDDNVFWAKQWVYGIDGRCNVGFGFWQMAHGSKQDLTAANYELARIAMTSMRGDYGRPLNLRPNLLVVPPQLEGAARLLLEAERNAAGATNIWRNSARLLVAPWLA